MFPSNVVNLQNWNIAYKVWIKHRFFQWVEENNILLCAIYTVYDRNCCLNDMQFDFDYITKTKHPESACIHYMM